MQSASYHVLAARKMFMRLGRPTFACAIALLACSQLVSARAQTTGREYDEAALKYADRLLEQGQEAFRFDTFGNESFWGGQLKLHRAIMGEQRGGVGRGLSLRQALDLGLKLDMDAVPKNLAAEIKAGRANLDDPANTLLLLKANAVVGLTGFFDRRGQQLTSIGIQCALCHSTVDNAFMPGIGHRLDGWPNRDINVGAIAASAPDLGAFADMLQVDEATVKKVLTSWGPGKFDAQLNLDGKTFRPDNKPAATLIPPTFGLAGVNQHTWAGSWGAVSYWTAYEANLAMHGQGKFYDPRLKNAEKYPVAARTAEGAKSDQNDRITAKLAALQFYQLSLPAPAVPPGSFDRTAASDGKAIFDGKARCGNCHVAPLFTEPGWNLHKADEIGIDDFQAKRSPDDAYRTTPLRALWDDKQIHKGGFYHDGRFKTLAEVVAHYDRHFALNLTEREKRNLVEYLKSGPTAEETQLTTGSAGPGASRPKRRP
jgi:hypothetical protein